MLVDTQLSRLFFIMYGADSKALERLSELVVYLRGERSQRQYAKDLGISYGTIRGWENQECFPSTQYAQILAEASGQTLDELMYYLQSGEEFSKYPTKKAEDLLPAVHELSYEEQVRLVQLVVGGFAATKPVPVEKPEVAEEPTPEKVKLNQSSHQSAAGRRRTSAA